MNEIRDNRIAEIKQDKGDSSTWGAGHTSPAPRPKSCPFCGGSFLTNKSNKLFCDPFCQYRMAQRNYKREYMRRRRMEARGTVKEFTRMQKSSPLARMCMGNEIERHGGRVD